MENLKYIRKNNNLTLKQLSEKLDIAESTLSMYENGKREPDFQTLNKLADFFGVTIDFLLDRNNLNTNKIPTNKSNTITLIARNGGKTEYEVPEENMELIQQMLDKLSKK